MNPGHRRQPQIIRPLAVVLTAAALLPATAAAQRAPGDPAAPCVSCLVIGVDPTELAPVPPPAPRSLDRVQLMLTGPPQRETLQMAGGTAGVLVTPSAAPGGPPTPLP